MIDTILLAVLVAEVTGCLIFAWWNPDEPRPASSGDRTPELAVVPPEPAWDDLEALERDLHVEGLIQAVDPTWKLGDDREHIALIPGADGHIEKAELR